VGTRQLKGYAVDDNASLEHEADMMGSKALQLKNDEKKRNKESKSVKTPVQRMKNRLKRELTPAEKTDAIAKGEQNYLSKSGHGRADHGKRASSTPKKTKEQQAAKSKQRTIDEVIQLKNGISSLIPQPQLSDVPVNRNYGVEADQPAHKLIQAAKQNSEARRRVPLTWKWPQQRGTIQLKLIGQLESINYEYLKNFDHSFPGLKKFKIRQEAFEHLKGNKLEISNDDDIKDALEKYFQKAEMPEGVGVAGKGSASTQSAQGSSESSGKSATSTSAPAPKIGITGSSGKASPPDSASKLSLSSSPSSSSSALPIPLKTVAVLSTKPAKEKESEKLPPPNAAPIPGSKVSQADASGIQAALELYESGRLLVTSVQPKDLPLMHKHESREEIEEHAQEGKLKNISTNPTGAMAHAKVNWTLTSPRMVPHYFKMVEPGELTPRKSDDPLGNRIATLADATRMGRTYMRGKEGKDDFSEWMQDQSSSKGAGVTEGAELFSFEDKKVKERFEMIKAQQEAATDQVNPEINSFGFPPSAVVGFLVVRLDEKTEKILTETKRNMSKEEQQRLIPVFTWEKANDERRPAEKWKMKFLKNI